MYIEFFVILTFGIIYGLVIGIIPAVGATTGLLMLFPLLPWFYSDPYLGIIFFVSSIAASTTGDSFTAILMGIPGANSAAATMVDGFPLAQQGKAAYALSAAITTSTINGAIWGTITWLIIPFSKDFILKLGIPEIWGFTVFSLCTVMFLSSRYFFRSGFAICFGIWIGLIGLDSSNVARWTFGWTYLNDGVQLMPIMAGIFIIPELISQYRSQTQLSNQKITLFTNQKQVKEGFIAAFNHLYVGIKGGIIGAIVGILPGLGGAVADWLSYSFTVANNKSDKFGTGNVKGVIGCEGANNAQKATSLIPTILFGIPGAPFSAVLMVLATLLGFEMGSPLVLNDQKFLLMIGGSFVGSTIVTGIICLLLIELISLIANIPYTYYFPIIFIIVIWACLQYTGGYEDIIIFFIFSVLGIVFKYYKISRPSIILGYILADRVEKLSWQISDLYSFNELLMRPIFVTIVFLALAVMYLGVTNQQKIDYT